MSNNKRKKGIEREKEKQDKKIRFILMSCRTARIWAANELLCGHKHRRQTVHALCYECVIHANDVYLIDTLRLELVVLLDVSRYLRAARGREGARQADLCLYVFVYICAFICFL
jgi:uncharacterized protein (UPF0179 family)